ncbi:MAG: hypothetical protein K2J84_05285 [Bacteroidaceae bacterium]|nr:hypothetical protein [Bacteroidaceae bacterium]
MINKFIKFSLFLVLAVCVGTASASNRKKVVIRDITVSLGEASISVSQMFNNLDYGLRIQVRSEANENNLINRTELPSKEAAALPRITLDNSLVSSTEQYLDRYATALGFRVSSDFNTDYILNVTIKDYSLRVRNYDMKNNVFNSSSAMVVSWELLNSDHEIVISSTTSTGRGEAKFQSSIASPLPTAFVQALSGIGWERIAPKLKIAKTAKQEKNKQVQGFGDTALESTVIRWYIVSAPQGADVSWRVVSSTPDVANTNSNFVGSTPYETTETFDIKGLTYNNSGNVQIEVSCEKAGYITQRKRFNLRQAIDQKEISAKFNLVKEDIGE